MDERLQTAFLGAVTEYVRDNPGKKIKIESAFRTPEDQIRAAREAAAAGRPYAVHGSSKHEKGAAIDIPAADAAAMRKYLERWGLGTPVPNDPGHIEPVLPNSQGKIGRAHV